MQIILIVCVCAYTLMTANMLDQEHLVLVSLPRVAHVCEMHFTGPAPTFARSCVLLLDPVSTDPVAWTASLVQADGTALQIGHAVCEPVASHWQLAVDGASTAQCVARPIPAWECATYAARRNTQEWLAQLRGAKEEISATVDDTEAAADGYRVMWRALRSKNAATHDVSSCVLCTQRRKRGKVALRSHRLCLQCIRCGIREQTLKAMKMHVGSGCSALGPALDKQQTCDP